MLENTYVHLLKYRIQSGLIIGNYILKEHFLSACLQRTSN